MTLRHSRAEAKGEKVPRLWWDKSWEELLIKFMAFFLRNLILLHISINYVGTRKWNVYSNVDSLAYLCIFHPILSKDKFCYVTFFQSCIVLQSVVLNPTLLLNIIQENPKLIPLNSNLFLFCYPLLLPTSIIPSSIEGRYSKSTQISCQPLKPVDSPYS